MEHNLNHKTTDFEIKKDLLEDVVVPSKNEVQRFHGSWFRGNNTNFIPSKKMLFEAGSFEKYILHGYKPDEPFINKTTVITAFGSCFAQNISKYLHTEGYNVLGKKLNLMSHIVRFGEGIVNTFAILEQLQWALEGKSLSSGLWFGSKKEIVTPDEISRENTRYLLNRTEVLILTVGLSEIWFDKDSGRAFWRAIPAKDYDESRHGFRLTSVEENFKNLQNIMLLRDQYLPNMKVIITLSPIPLMATFREVNCISANSTSKAILRVAIDLMMSEKHKQLYYFPSYELFKEVYVNPFQADNRHPREELVLNTMKLFERVYCN